MTITEFSIRFDRPLYYPGQMITGQVTVTLDKPKDIKGVELKLKGRTKFQWEESESYTDSEGKSQTRIITRVGKETYLTTKINLVGGKTELTIGVHTYPFAVMLPTKSPSTFNGKYGGIDYYAKAKVDIPLAFDKTVKNFFKVENLLDLNHLPHLKNSTKKEKSKTFCCFCCASGPLTMVVHIPKTGFAKTEAIPITVEVDNASNVSVNSVKAELSRKIHWKADGNSKDEKDKLKKLTFGGVPENSSKTWSENLSLDCGPFPNLANCNIISVEYKLEVEADPNGAHSDLEVEIPITIGDIPFHDGESLPPTNVGQLPVAPGFQQQANPAVPGVFVPPEAGVCYPNVPSIQNPDSNVGFSSSNMAPYPSVPSGMNPTSYTSGGTGDMTSVPYPSNPVGVNMMYPSVSGGNPQGPYPPASNGNYQGPYPPVSGSNPPGPYPSASGNPQGPYPPFSGGSYQGSYPPPCGANPEGPYASAPGGGSQEPYQTHSPYAPPPSAPPPVGSGQLYQNGPTPVNSAEGNSVTYPYGTHALNSAYDPNSPSANSAGAPPQALNATLAQSGGLFNSGTMNMPASIFPNGNT